MSSSWQQIQDLAREHTACPYCGVDPGEPCVTETGHTARYMHQPRILPLHQAWNIGWDEGIEEMAWGYTDKTMHGWFNRQIENYQRKQAS